MAETTNTVEIKTVVDATGVEVGLRRIGEAAAKTGRDLEKVGSGAGFNKIGADADGAAKKVITAERNLIGSIQRTTAAMESGGRTSAKYYELLAQQRGIDGSVLAPYLEQLRAVEAAQAKANVALGAAAPSLDRVGLSAKQTAAALRGVPAQFTDIFTSLQGGQAPLTVFLQQGGQLKDMFGGAGNAARAMGGYIVGLVNPFTIAAVAAAGLAVAYNQGSREADAYARALIMTGNAAGTTSDQLSDMARNISATVGTQGAAAEALAAIAGTGRVAAKDLQYLSEVAVKAQSALGISAADMAKDFAELGKAPLKSSEQLTEKYRYLTAAVYEQIKAAEEQGRVEDAASIAQDAYARAMDERAGKVKASLGTLQTAWMSVGTVAKKTWDAMLNIGREDTLTEKLTRVRAQIEKARKPFDPAFGGNAEARAQLQANIALEASLQRQIKGENEKAAAQAASIKQQEAMQAWRREGDKYLSRELQMKREIERAEKEGATAKLSSTEIDKRVAAIREKYAEKAVATSKSNGDALRKEAALMAELAGLASSFAADWDALSAAYARGKINLSQLTEAQAKLLAKQPAIKAANDAQAKSLADQANFMERAQAAVDRDVESVESQTAALMLKVKTYGMLPAAITDVQIAELEMAKQSLVLTDAGIADIQRKIDALKGLRDAQANATALDEAPDVAKAKELLDILVAVDNATKSAANGMAASFGKVGSAIGGLTVALSEYGVQQQAIVAKLTADKADPKNKNDPDKISKMEIAAAQASAQAKIKSYGDMASAAKGFFKENSTGYKVMEGVEKTYRATQMAMEIQTMLTKSGLVTAFTSLFVASKATEIGAETTKTGVSVGLAGTEASAWGVTAVVKSLASLPFPLNLAAGAATLAAVVAIGAKMVGGVGGGSSASKTTFEEKQKLQGTGTVMGDASAKSESIAKSLDMMEGYAALELDYQSSMLTALRNIEMALGGAAKGIMQTAGITGGSAFGTVNSSSSNFFGSDKTTTIADTGVKFSGTFGALRTGGGNGSQYEDVIKTSDGGWFRGNSTKQFTQTKNLTAEAMKPFALIFDNMGELLVDAGVKLGRDGASLTSAINGIGVDFEVSLRNLKGQELTDALNAGVSVAFDKVTKQLFPSIEQFQKMGEGIGETLVRVATNVQAVDSVFAAMGKSASVAMEAKTGLVEAAGGLDKFASSASSFMRNFYSEAEQVSMSKARLQPVLGQFGLSTEGANAQTMFRDFVLGLDVSTAAGAKTYAMLMDVQQAFKDVTSAGAAERIDLQKQLEQMTLTEVQLLAKRRAELDPSNRLLFDQVQAMKAAREAQDAAKASMSGLIDRMKSFGDSARSLRDGLLMGSLSTLTPEQQYAEARRQRDTTLSAAMAGDTNAQNNLSAMQTAFLTISQKVNGGDDRYSSDFAEVLRISNDVASWSNGQIDTAQASLNVMGDQLAQLIQMNATLQTVANAASVSPIANIGVPDYSTMGTANTTALVNEVKALNVRLDAQTKVIEGLRSDQKQQTGDLIGAAVEISNRESDTVVKGVGAALNRGAGRYDNGVNLE